MSASADSDDDDEIEDDDDEIEDDVSWFGSFIVTSVVGLLAVVIAKVGHDLMNGATAIKKDELARSHSVIDIDPGEGPETFVIGGAVAIVAGLSIRFACGCFATAPRARRRLLTITVIKPTTNAPLGVRMESEADDGELTYVQTVRGLFAQAGVRPHDRLVSINDERVTSATHAASLLASMAADSRIKVQVERGPRRRRRKRAKDVSAPRGSTESEVRSSHE